MAVGEALLFYEGIIFLTVRSTGSERKKHIFSAAHLFEEISSLSLCPERAVKTHPWRM